MGHEQFDKNAVFTTLFVSRDGTRYNQFLLEEVSATPEGIDSNARVGQESVLLTKTVTGQELITAVTLLCELGEPRLREQISGLLNDARKADNIRAIGPELLSAGIALASLMKSFIPENE